jgi:hypothetical protein
MECSEPPLALAVSCTYGEPVPPDGVLAMQVNVLTSGAAGSVLDSATVEGGGAAAAVAGVSNSLDGSPTPFGLADYRISATDQAGGGDTQAAGHPYEMTASFDFNTHLQPATDAIGVPTDGPVEEPSDIVAYLPPGVVGNPTAVETCPESALLEGTFQAACPRGSIVGSVTLQLRGAVDSTGVVGGPSAIYNLAPDRGYPAEFGFSILRNPVIMYAAAVWHGGGYRIRLSTRGLPQETLSGVSLTFFGDPSEKSHSRAPARTFLRSPTGCTREPVVSRLEAASYREPHRWASAEAPVYSSLEGCDVLQFNPQLTLTPDTAAADTPSGYEVSVKVPQAEGFPGVPATPDLKNATVSLPAGVAISPAAADGLTGCPESGPEGVEFAHGTSHPDEAGEGEEIGPDGFSRLAPGHCPATSAIGVVEVLTPLLAEPLKGHLFVGLPLCGGEAQPACDEASAASGKLFRVYLEASGAGVIIKLKGSVEVDPLSGHAVVRFAQNPQLPFEELKVKLDGGARAPLANPQRCGTATTSALLEPWGGPSATPGSEYTVTGCAAAMLFAPAFSAGTLTPLADGFSSFSLTFSRHDGEQDLAGASIHMPPGLLGKIADVPPCGEPQAREGTCSAASRIGTAHVAAGSGSQPLWLAGPVYLTTAYRGAPYGLSVVVPAKAGPFNLGNEVVRAAITVDAQTSALSVTSDPLPQIKDGVPFRLKTVSVTIDRPNFMFNPTNCRQQAITGTILGLLPGGAAGSTVPVATPFAAAGCKNLPFNPRFAVLTQAHASKANGASLHVKVTSGAGQANIGKVRVDLPKQLPSRLTTLQKACPDAVFNANPASCPPASSVGTAVAVTPVLKAPLSGPAYLVSHAGASFPDLVVVLQGEGIRLDLVGNTDIKKGVTISTFNTVPDAPISTFDLVLPEGPHSALAAYGNLCRTRLNMPTALTGQNGAEIKQTTRIAVSGCPKHKHAKRAKTHRKGRSGRR